MINHVVSRLGFGLVEFEGGAAVEIDPPANLSVGDTVQVEVSGFARVSISSMRWTDKGGEEHFISYDIDGNPR